MNAEFIKKRKEMLLAQEHNNPIGQWWSSFCDPKKPAGKQFLGVVIVESPGFIHAHQKASELGINPGGEIYSLQVEGIPAQYLDKLLTWDCLEKAGLVSKQEAE